MADQNQNPLLATVPEDDQFLSPDEFLNANTAMDWDSLLTRGNSNSNQTASKWERDSLYVKFDPLVASRNPADRASVLFKAPKPPGPLKQQQQVSLTNGNSPKSRNLNSANTSFNESYKTCQDSSMPLIEEDNLGTNGNMNGSHFAYGDGDNSFYASALDASKTVEPLLDGDGGHDHDNNQIPANDAEEQEEYGEDDCLPIAPLSQSYTVVNSGGDDSLSSMFQNIKISNDDDEEDSTSPSPLVASHSPQNILADMEKSPKPESPKATATPGLLLSPSSSRPSTPSAVAVADVIPLPPPDENLVANVSFTLTPCVARDSPNPEEDLVPDVGSSNEMENLDSLDATVLSLRAVSPLSPFEGPEEVQDPLNEFPCGTPPTFNNSFVEDRSSSSSAASGRTVVLSARKSILTANQTVSFNSPNTSTSDGYYQSPSVRITPTPTPPNNSDSRSISFADDSTPSANTSYNLLNITGPGRGVGRKSEPLNSSLITPESVQRNQSKRHSLSEQPTQDDPEAVALAAKLKRIGELKEQLAKLDEEYELERKQNLEFMKKQEYDLNELVTMYITAKEQLEETKQLKEQVTSERDEALRDQRTMESRFAEMLMMYEGIKKCEGLVEHNCEVLKKREDILNAALQKREERDATALRYFNETVDQMKVEFDSQISDKEAENAKLHAKVRYCEMKVSNLEGEIAQVDRENAQLKVLCDDLLKK